MGQVVTEEMLKDMHDGIKEAEVMNENMRMHGTIDIPMDAQKMKREQLIAEAVADGRKLVTIRTINAIDDIPDADLIKVATVEGWKVVVKAGEFKPGDFCVYFEVDSFLPMDDDRYAFLEKNAITWNGIRGARLKTITLRRQRSQGLALPVDIFPEVQVYLDRDDLRDINFTGILGIMKWEKPINPQLAGTAKGSFPSFLQKSDQERCQNMVSSIFGYEKTFRPVPSAATLLPEEIEKAIKADRMCTIDGVLHIVHQPQASRDTQYEVTLKLDGSSMTVYRRGEGDKVEEGVCSRNLELKMEGNENNSFVQMANEGVLQALRDADVTNVALQGELMGPGIQGNRESLSFNRFFVYNVFDIRKGEYMKPEDRIAFLDKLNAEATVRNGFRVEHVPILYSNVTLAELGIHNMDDLLKFAIGPSMHNNVREGLVFKAMDGSQQFKAISNLYLEQEK